MAYRTPPGIYAAVVAGSVIILDRKCDRYWALPQSLGPTFQHAISAASDADARGLKQLVDLGVLQRAAEPTDAPSPPSRLQARLNCDGFRPGAMLIVRAYFGIWRSRWRLRYQGLDRCLSKFEQLQQKPVSETATTADIVAAFDQCAAIVGRTDRCLSMSLALASSLRRHGIAARLVIGVRTGPFSAHCWVQVDDQLLVDHMDFVSRFVPILVL